MSRGSRGELLMPSTKALQNCLYEPQRWLHRLLPVRFLLDVIVRNETPISRARPYISCVFVCPSHPTPGLGFFTRGRLAPLTQTSPVGGCFP